MRPDEPSATARRVAVRRAAHQLLDRPPLVDDPIALRLLDAETRATLVADPGRFERGPVAPYLRAFLAARQRLAEDVLADAHARGVRQYVVLGAGLDTFAWRNPHAGLSVFEVDHPQTQAWKRTRLAEAGLAAPEGLRFVPLELEQTPLAAALAAAGLRLDAPAVVALLGVSMYLTREALAVTLAAAGALPAGSAIVLDYAQPRPDDERGARVFDAMAERVARADEPWLTFFSPAELERELRANGFAAVEHFGRAELHARYFEGRADGLTVGRLAGVAVARVG